jgi:hypothetical protein
MNAADDEKRGIAIEAIRTRFEERRAEGHSPYLRVLMHSLAFGTLLPFIADDPREAVNRKQLEMTLDVMANSLVFWTQDLYRAGLFDTGSKIYTITPALMKIPEHDAIIEASNRRNPSGRMTTPRDVANAIVALSGDGFDFLTGNVIGVDGGEYITG